MSGTSVLNDVNLIGHYGGDESHALSAWTSTDRSPDKMVRMPALLQSLAKDGHHTPFEKSALHFLVTCDTASHIHILKHRIAVSVNGESARYKEHTEDKYYVPDDWPMRWQTALEMYTERGFKLYHSAVEDLTAHYGGDLSARKRAKETARFFLPYSSQVTLDVMFNFRSFMAFQTLRNDEHAQGEIRAIAQDMLLQVRDLPGNPFHHSLRAFGHFA